MKNFKLFLTLAFCSVFFHSLISEKAAKAQITSIKTNEFTGVIHDSTGQFSVPIGQTAFFNNVSNITNNIPRISCQATGSQDQSEFIVTGSGGLPPNPSESLRSSAVATNLTISQPNQNTTQSKPIVEAQSWIVNEHGNVVLTANANTANPAGNFLPPAGCSQ
jgi:large exoprotein involved in heme utilization and adhesion